MEGGIDEAYVLALEHFGEAPDGTPRISKATAAQLYAENVALRSRLSEIVTKLRMHGGIQYERGNRNGYARSLFWAASEIEAGRI